MTAARVALLRSFETHIGSFAVGCELEISGVYPDQGRRGGDFLHLSLGGERVLSGVRPAEGCSVRMIAGFEDRAKGASS